MSLKRQENNRLMKQAGYASVSVAVFLVSLKAVTFMLTGSVAILSSLFDSVQDMMTSAINMIAIRQSVNPADKEHRFGHGKAQAIGSLIQSFIITAAGLFLLLESVERFCRPQPLNQIGIGLVIMVVAVLSTIILVHFQSYVIRRTQSLSVKADKTHYTGDILMNIGVMVSMVLTYLTGWTRWDSLFGCGVAIYLFIIVYQIIRESFGMLMDTEMPEDFRKQIEAVACSFPPVKNIRDLRTRQSGSNAFVQFCIILDESLTLRQAHDITDQIEDKIKERFPDTEIIIHPEPQRNKS